MGECIETRSKIAGHTWRMANSTFDWPTIGTDVEERLGCIKATHRRVASRQRRRSRYRIDSLSTSGRSDFHSNGMETLQAVGVDRRHRRQDVRKEFETLGRIVAGVDRTFHSLFVRKRTLWLNRSEDEVILAAALAMTLSPVVLVGDHYAR